MSEQFEPAPSPFAPPAPYEQLIDVASVPEPAKRKKWAIVAGVAAVVAVGVGVGVVAFGGSDEAEARFSLSAAAASAETAQNVAYEMKMEMGEVGVMDAAGTLDTDSGVMRMNMSMPALGVTKIDVIFDLANKKMYMASEAFAGQGLDVPTEWIGFDASELPGIDEALEQNTNNPLDYAKVFDIAKSTEDLGVEDFRGEQVKHYRVVVLTADAVAATPSLQQQIDQMGSDFPDEMTYDVWVTSESQLRRVTFDIAVAGQALKADIVYTAIGTIDPIAIPAAADVTELSELMGG